jgi:hypothetical protein
MKYIFTGGDVKKEANSKFLIGKKFKDNIPLFSE